MGMQSLVRLIYPPQCIGCGEETDSDFGLCGPCWRETVFIDGAICDTCGTPLPGPQEDEVLQCDDCIQIARPWAQGRAALVYTGTGRKVVLRLKHSDRTELARPAALWMAKVAKPLLRDNTLFLPVPLHWTRRVRRKYNQAALLAQNIGKTLDVPVCPDGLSRPKRTLPLEGHNRQARFSALQGAITANPRRAHLIKDKAVIIVDDVMTSGATLAACTEAALGAGAATVSILTLARVVKDA